MIGTAQIDAGGSFASITLVFGPTIYLGGPQLALLGPKSTSETLNWLFWAPNLIAKTSKYTSELGKLLWGHSRRPFSSSVSAARNCSFGFHRAPCENVFNLSNCSATTSSAYLACQPPRSLHNAVPNPDSSALPAPQFKSSTRSTG